jgi:hypothetical protein
MSTVYVDDRTNYNLAKSRCPVNTIITQSELRVQAALAIGQADYNFQLLSNTNTTLVAQPEQVTLDQPDRFFITSIGMFIGNDGGVAGQMFLQPSEQGLAAAADYYNLYNGKINLTIDNYNFLENLPAWNHYDNLETAGTAAAPAFSESLDTNGFFGLLPLITLDGNQKVQFSLNTVQGMAAPDANTFIVFRLRGFLAQGCAGYSGRG